MRHPESKRSGEAVTRATTWSPTMPDLHTFIESEEVSSAMAAKCCTKTQSSTTCLRLPILTTRRTFRTRQRVSCRLINENVEQLVSGAKQFVPQKPESVMESGRLEDPAGESDMSSHRHVQDGCEWNEPENS